MTESPNYNLAARMAELARTAAAPRTVNEVLGDVTATAQELIPGVDTAGVLMIAKGGKWASFGGTSDLPHKLDEFQMAHGEGPCAEAALDEVIVRTDDFRTEERWPKYSPEAVRLGVLSGLSFKLYTANRTAGALNLFAFEPHAFDGEALHPFRLGAPRVRRGGRDDRHCAGRPRRRGDPSQPRRRGAAVRAVHP